ncbi:hypothetical protein JW711_03595 [Candidatus Woesearchaeota archaeon]|nr:hypothetical protein [Candidatus Woesearchaeota archaeon]
MDKAEAQGPMIKIIVLHSLRDEIYKTFKKESLKVYSLMEALKANPSKGKVLGHVGSVSIRELKYESFRFYFILDGHRLILFSKGKIEELLIRFVKMSKKNHQQKTIDEIKAILKAVGEGGF